MFDDEILYDRTMVGHRTESVRGKTAKYGFCLERKVMIVILNEKGWGSVERTLRGPLPRLEIPTCI